MNNGARTERADWPSRTDAEQPCRIFIVEDDAILRASLIDRLKREPDMLVVGEADCLLGTGAAGGAPL